MVTRGVVDRVSAVVAVMVIRWRRAGVVSLTLTLNASARTEADRLELCAPFDARTTAR